MSREIDRVRSFVLADAEPRCSTCINRHRCFDAKSSMRWELRTRDAERFLTAWPRVIVTMQETAQRIAAIQWIQDHLAPIFEEAQLPYFVDIVPYETQSSSIGEILVEKASLIDDVVAIVLASSSKGRIREFFVGSVCNYVLHHSRRPVFVFKPTVEDEKREAERVEKLVSKSQDKQQKAE